MWVQHIPYVRCYAPRMRVGRGLFRLWLVLSVLWIGAVVGAVGWVTWTDFTDDPACRLVSLLTGANCFPPVRGLPPGFYVEHPQEIILANRSGAVQRGIPLALLPPAFVLALGAALVWAIRGFR